MLRPRSRVLVHLGTPLFQNFWPAPRLFYMGVLPPQDWKSSRRIVRAYCECKNAHNTDIRKICVWHRRYWACVTLISFYEAVVVLLRTRSLGKRYSHGPCFVYRCIETIIELGCMRPIKRESGFSCSGFKLLSRLLSGCSVTAVQKRAGSGADRQKFHACACSFESIF